MYAFEQIDGINRAVIGGAFPSREDAKRYALDWLAAHGYDAFFVEDDDIDDGIDFMTERDRSLHQFAINPVR